MCFSPGISGFFAASSLVMAAICFYLKLPQGLAIGSLFFGSMELLQTLSYFVIAEPEDNFSMCANSTNQFLTLIGYLHIIFQPFMANVTFFSMHRTPNVTYRIVGDFIQRLCLFQSLWMLARYAMAVYGPESYYAGPPTIHCPNYELIREGYDGSHGYMTPNVPGHSCTFRSPSGTGHLAWAVPLYQNTYLMPSASLHFFMMFVPALVCAQHDHMLRFMTAVLFVTGPFFVNYFVTDVVGEQASVWCILSMVQFGLLVVGAAFLYDRNEASPESLSHAGQLGEQPLEYTLAASKPTNGHSNGYANGKTKAQ